MADSPPNLGQNFSAMVTEWERNFDAFANQVMGTEAYSQAMNDMQRQQLTAQRALSEGMAKQLAALNMPTREDVMLLADMIRQLDARMERIEQALMPNAPAAASPRKRPARTRQPEPGDDATGSTAKAPPKKRRSRKQPASDPS